MEATEYKKLIMELGFNPEIMLAEVLPPQRKA
jgi:hypothetical protein